MALSRGRFREWSEDTAMVLSSSNRPDTTLAGVGGTAQAKCRYPYNEGVAEVNATEDPLSLEAREVL